MGPTCKNPRRWRLIIVGILLLALPARAQGPVPPRPSPWSFEITPYLWASGFEGGLSARGRSASVDPSFSDLVKDLDFGALAVDFQRGGFELDVIMHGPVVGLGFRF